MTSSPPSPSPDPLPIRWAVILLASIVVALLIGLFTYVQSRNWPAALLAALAAGGATVPALHQLLAR